MEWSVDMNLRFTVKLELFWTDQTGLMMLSGVIEIKNYDE